MLAHAALLPAWLARSHVCGAAAGPGTTLCPARPPHPTPPHPYPNIYFFGKAAHDLPHGGCRTRPTQVRLEEMLAYRIATGGQIDFDYYNGDEGEEEEASNQSVTLGHHRRQAHRRRAQQAAAGAAAAVAAPRLRARSAARRALLAVLAPAPPPAAAGRTPKQQQAGGNATGGEREEVAQVGLHDAKVLARIRFYRRVAIWMAKWRYAGRGAPGKRSESQSRQGVRGQRPRGLLFWHPYKIHFASPGAFSSCCQSCMLPATHVAEEAQVGLHDPHFGPAPEKRTRLWGNRLVLRVNHSYLGSLQ
jgi:hypothetical protein